MNDIIKGILPWIGTALGGPLGAGVATFVASKLGVPEDTVTQTLTNMVGNPEDAVKLKQLELDFQSHCLELGYKNITDLEQINSTVLVEVNKTMQTEASSDHWPSYSWRPAIGFCFAAYILSLCILPLFHVVPVTLNSDMVLCIGGILGVASYFRGKSQAINASSVSDKG